MQLHARDRDVARFLASLVTVDVVVDLARAEHQLGHGLAPAVREARIVDHALEVAVGEVLERGRGRGQPQQALRRHHDQRARLRDERLAAEQVEVLGRGGAVRDPDVALGRGLEEALDAAARMLGARALVAVGEQQREARGLAPLGEPGHEELVDDHLGAVHEVAELRLPQHERVGRLDAVAVLEAHAGLLGERAVVELERGVRVAQVLERAVALARLRVVEHRVALAERAALRVLAGEAHRHAERQQRARSRATPRAPSRSARPPRAPRGASRAAGAACDAARSPRGSAGAARRASGACPPAPSCAARGSSCGRARARPCRAGRRSTPSARCAPGRPARRPRSPCARPPPA